MDKPIYGTPATTVKLDDQTVMPWPAEDLRSAYLVGEHRIVEAVLESDPADTDWRWMCFDHGWDCWMTKAAQETDG